MEIIHGGRAGNYNHFSVFFVFEGKETVLTDKLLIFFDNDKGLDKWTNCCSVFFSFVLIRNFQV